MKNSETKTIASAHSKTDSSPRRRRRGAPGADKFRLACCCVLAAVAVFAAFPASTAAGKSPGRAPKRAGAASSAHRGSGASWKRTCLSRTTSWDQCSKWCGLGLSTRVHGQPLNGTCVHKRESRLCKVRPCKDFKPKGGKNKRRCTRHIRSRKRETLTYIGGKSVQTYRMRYCGKCTDTTKCCTPLRTTTRTVLFRRPDESVFKKKMMFVRKCRCHTRCDTPSVGRYGLALHNDMLRQNELSAAPVDSSSAAAANR